MSFLYVEELSSILRILEFGKGLWRRLTTDWNNWVSYLYNPNISAYGTVKPFTWNWHRGPLGEYQKAN